MLLSKKIPCFVFFRVFLAAGTSENRDAQGTWGASLHHPCQPMAQLPPLWKQKVIKYAGMSEQRKKWQKWQAGGAGEYV